MHGNPNHLPLLGGNRRPMAIFLSRLTSGRNILTPSIGTGPIRLRTNAHGLEYLEIDGQPFKYMPAGALAAFGAMGKKPPDRAKPDPSMTYVGRGTVWIHGRPGTSPAAGPRRLGKGYPVSQHRSESGRPRKLATWAYQAALTTAYNRWITEFCADTNGRLIPVAHISMGDPHEAAKELETLGQSRSQRSILCAVHPDG